jgi:hypothetical protein
MVGDSAGYLVICFVIHIYVRRVFCSHVLFPEMRTKNSGEAALRLEVEAASTSRAGFAVAALALAKKMQHEKQMAKGEGARCDANECFSPYARTEKRAPVSLLPRLPLKFNSRPGSSAGAR